MNHSLRATAITWIFNGQVDEKVIAEASGHKTLKALRSYEHTCKEKLKNVSRVLSETNNTDSTGTSSKDSKCLLLEAVDEEQITKTECKNVSVKEEKISDNGDSSM